MDVRSFWISVMVLPGDEGGTKQQPGARLLTHCISMTRSLPWRMPFHFYLFMAINNVTGALGWHLWPNPVASHAECGLNMVFCSSTRNVGKVFYCDDSFFLLTLVMSNELVEKYFYQETEDVMQTTSPQHIGTAALVKHNTTKIGQQSD